MNNNNNNTKIYNAHVVGLWNTPVYTMIKKTGPLTLCHIALSFHDIFSQKSTKCLRKLGAVNSNLIHVPPGAGVRTLLCNVDVKITSHFNKITILRTVHVTQLKC